MFYTILLVVEVLLSMALIAVVLLQQGKGADAGAAFGSGSSGTVFGASGSGSFMSRTTAILAMLFFLNTLALAYLAGNQSVTSGSVVDQIIQQQETISEEQPADLPALDSENAPAAEQSDVPEAPAADQTSDVPAQ